jgi:photosystem II stability/assembly factor-like uncharacterized protein
MPRLRFALAPLLVATTLGAAPLQNQWVSHGPVGGVVRSLAVAPLQRNVVYAAAPDGVFRSANGGASWTAVTGPLVNPAAVRVRGADPNAVIAAGQNGIFRSDDGGATWQAAAGVPTPLSLAGLVIDPRDSNVIYAAGRCYLSPGVLKSTDGGRTFLPANNGLDAFKRCVERFTLDPAAPDHLFLWYTYQGDVYGAMWSTNGGANWTSTSIAATQTIVAAPKDRNRRFGLDAGSLLTSEDGTLWSRIFPQRSDRPMGSAAALTIDPDSGRLFIGTFLGAFRSGDRGYDWLSLDGAARDSIQALDFDPAGGALMIGTDAGIFRSDGAPWNDWTALPIGNNAFSIQLLAADPSNAEVYAFAGRHLFRTSNRGSSWSEVAPPLARTPFAATVDAGHELYAAYYDGASHLVRLRADGSAWDELRKESGFQEFEGLAAHPRRAGILYYTGRSSSRLVQTRDRGASWQEVPSPPGGVVLNALADARDPNTFLAVTTDGSRMMLKKTNDGGRTWSGNKVPENWRIFWVTSSPAHPDVIYATLWPGETRPTLARSVDGGESWNVLSQQPGYFDNSSAGLLTNRLAIDPRDPDVVYVATAFNGAGLVRTRDGGVSWQSISEGLPAAVAPVVAITPDGLTLFAGTEARSVWQLDLSPRRRAVGR